MWNTEQVLKFTNSIFLHEEVEARNPNILVSRGNLALDRGNNMATLRLLRFCDRNSAFFLSQNLLSGLTELSITNSTLRGFIRRVSDFTSVISDETTNKEISQPDSYSGTTSRKQESPNSKLLRVAIIGEANSGKSTLTNYLTGQKISAVTQVPHTTRKQTLGAFMVGHSQIVLLDTPGVVTLSEARRLKMTRQHILAPREALEDADLIAVISDVTDKRRSLMIHESILKGLESHADIPSILILNKVDRIKHKMILLNIADALIKDREKDKWGNYIGTGGWSKFEQVFMISAGSGDGVDNLKEFLAVKSKPGDWLFPSEICTDQPFEEQMQEVFREKLLQLYEHEIPWQIKQVHVGSKIIPLDDFFSHLGTGGGTYFINILALKWGSRGFE